MLGLLLPEFLRLVEYLGALHPEEQEHRDDGQQGGHRVRDDELENNSTISKEEVRLQSSAVQISSLIPVAT